MNLKRYLRLVMTAVAVAAVGIGIWGCEAPDTAQPETAELDTAAPSDESLSERNKVGGSYGKNGVAPFGMAQRLPIPIDPVAASAPDGETAESTTASLAEQNALFGIHCAACHGPDGLGVEPLGVTLVGSPFVQASSVDELVAMLKVGRLPDSADSVKGRVMPGFAWMSDEQLVDLAGFLKAQNP